MQRSAFWFLLPLLLGVVGGIIMWFVVKNDDRQMANIGLLIGVIITGLSLMFSFGGILLV